MALLINNQAQFLAQLARSEARSDERFARSDERFARIEAELAEIKLILLRHEQMLQALPEAIRQKIGFQTPQ
jgi:hypothetical protein